MRLHRGGIAGVTALALFAAALAIAPSGGAQVPPGPRFGDNYLMPPVTTARARDVPGLAVNPQNPNHIVSADSDPLNLECDYHVSFDGGRTWTGGHLRSSIGPAPACNQNFDSGGYHHLNAGIVFGSGQNVYITFSVHRGAFNRPESNLDGGFGDDSVVARSTDGGRTFQPAVLAIPGGGQVLPSNPGLAGVGMRPRIAVERGAGTGGQDRLYVTSWNCYIKVRASQTARGGCSGGGGDRRIWATRSNDGGATWSAPVLASAANVRAGGPCNPACTPGTAAAEAGSPDEQAREPSEPVVGPDGAVYVAYRNRDITNGTTCPANPAITSPAGGFPANLAHCIVVARSTNQGQSWQQFNTNLPVSTGTLSNPRLAIDPTTPAGVGTLYLTFERPPGANNTDTDVVLQRSTDRGQTWSAPVRVNDDPVGITQTNPMVSVGPGGRVDVIWADRRHPYPGGGTHADMYYARSSDNGVSFGPNRRVTDRTINVTTGRYGDFGSDFSPGFSWYGPVSLPLPDGSVLAGWQDSRLGNFETGYQDTFLSRLNPSAPIARQSVATATPAGLSVRLSQRTWPGGNEALAVLDPATRVVVASQNDPAGALAGSVLARANWGPLLLSPASALPGFVRSESQRIRPEGAYVIGDTSTLSTAVSRDLRDTTREGENIVRVAAPASTTAVNRPAEVARRVAELMRPLPGANPEAVIVNPGSPEAAAGAGLAAALKLPILFVDTRTTIPPPTATAISQLGIRRLLIVGGTGSVNAAVEGALATAVSGAANVKRLGGANQYEVSEAVVQESRLRGLPANVVYVADGDRPVDGAALGAAVARLGGLMLLRPGADTASAEGRIAQPIAGLNPALVDRIVGARGTGGSDPAVATRPRQAPIGYPVPPATLALAGCPPARTARNVIALSTSNDRRNGTPFGDLIFAGAGNDVIDALAGDDCVDLGPGADRGEGGAGNDFLVGGIGDDLLSGSAGRDRLNGNLGNDRIVAGTGDDSVLAGTGVDSVFGGLGNDRLHGQSGNDKIAGSRGRDRVNGGSGRDRITGGSSADRISGDADSDRIDGGSSDDLLKGNSGNDRISGRTGRDRMSGGSGNDRISARDGAIDRIDCGLGRDTVTADRFDRVARNCERVRRR